MKRITKLNKPIAATKNIGLLRVAAYARVSTDSNAQEESLKVQKEHYESYIATHSNWQFAGLYYDEGITGTKKDIRPALTRMMGDCRTGKIDRILTKSISRFSRNTTDCLEMIRELQSLGISIYFEKEQIDTGAMENELFLTLLSSFAEDESYSISQNSKWSIKRRFENGKYKLSYPPYGYQWNGEEIIIDPEQAEIVKEIFAMALDGKSTTAIAKELSLRGVPTKRGGQWASSTISEILTNEKYTGDVLFQKTYTDDHFKRHRNDGEKAQYFVAEHHEAIVSKEDFEKAGALLSLRSKKRKPANYQARYAFSGKIICGTCGCTFKRQTRYLFHTTIISWCCQGHIEDKARCNIKAISDESLKAAFVILLNKLIFSGTSILKPYMESLKNDATDASLSSIQRLETEIAACHDQEKTLQGLLTERLIDYAFFQKEAQGILREKNHLQAQIAKLEKNVEGNVSTFEQTKALLRFVLKDQMQEAFDESLFSSFVKQIRILSRDECLFEMKCGLNLKERI
ncbi:MAG: recombinase family protein [Atopobium minutum]|nr:recombinase family protein [Atopobium minutum]